VRLLVSSTTPPQIERDSYLIDRGVVSNQLTPASRFLLALFFTVKKVTKSTPRGGLPRSPAKKNRVSMSRCPIVHGSAKYTRNCADLRVLRRAARRFPTGAARSQTVRCAQVNVTFTSSLRVERNYKSTGRTARYCPPKPSAGRCR
jgi:hypothetical protein